MQAQERNETDDNATTPTEADLYKYLDERARQNPMFTPGKELDTCRHMVTRNVENWHSNDTAFNLTQNEISLIALSCNDNDISRNLTALGYDVDHFCPKMSRLLPMRFRVVPDGVVEDMDSFCNFIINDLWPIAGEFDIELFPNDMMLQLPTL